MVEWIVENAEDTNVYIMSLIVILPLAFLVALPLLVGAIVKKKNIGILNKEINWKTQVAILLAIQLIVLGVGGYFVNKKKEAVCNDLKLQSNCLDDIDYSSSIENDATDFAQKIGYPKTKSIIE